MAHVPRRTLLVGAALAPLAAPSAPAWADPRPLSAGENLTDIRDFGAIGDGRTDDTAAIETAFSSARAAGGALYIPPGNYLYSGPGLNAAVHGSIEVIGDARFSSKISLGPSSYFINYGQYLNGLLVRDITFVGGRGAIRHTYSGINVQQKHLVQNCRFKDYTECAISTESSDMPYWLIQNCFFDASNTVSTIAVALGPGSDQCVIDSCSFIRNRVHIKARTGNNLHIARCDFIQFSDDNSAGPRAAVWIVPHPTPINAGTGLTVTSSKFGNEALMPGDFRLLYADETPGESIGSRFPSLDAESRGFIRGHNVTQNAFIGAGANSHPIIYSTTSNVWELQVHHNALAGGQPSSVIDFRTPSPNPDRLAGGSVFGPFTGPVGIDFVAFPASNAVGIAHLADPQALLERSDTVRTWPSGASASFRQLLTQPITSFVKASASTTSITDAYGAADAVTFTMTTGSGSLSCELPIPFVIGMPLWVEFDIAAPAGGQAAAQIFAMVSDGPAVFHWRRCLDVDRAH